MLTPSLLPIRGAAHRSRATRCHAQADGCPRRTVVSPAMAELPARRRLREKQEREGGASSPEGGAYAADPVGAGGGEGGDGASVDSSAAERNKDAWRTFGTGTEAGRLLKQLYGDRSKPQIKYPKVRTEARGPVPAFVPAGGKHDVDAREAKPDAPRVNVPRPTGGAPRRQLTAIEYNELMGGRRKRGAAIAHELAQRQEDLDRYRPMPTKAKGTALEKQRLQNINMFKGGKALPDELTLAPIEGNIPLGMMMDPAKARARARRELERKAAAESSKPKATRKTVAMELFDQVAAEIDERVEFLNKMKALGQGKELEATVRGEIADRTVQLERLHEMISAEAAAAASEP